MALTVALETSRKETESYKNAAIAAQARVAEVEGSYQNLIQQLKEEVRNICMGFPHRRVFFLFLKKHSFECVKQGAFLSKRDQDRLRKAQKEVADYEIYKSVMEAAMIKMQGQIDLLLKDNEVSH